jgi:hypothetical protein
VDYLDQLRVEERAQVETWKTLDELDDAQRGDAQVVVNAMNDVAQYVTDGLPMHSALQQYHTIFVRLGFLILPYVDLKNQPVAGHPQTRIGRRLVHLYNGAIRYHRRHPKHRGRELALQRVSDDGAQQRLVLLDKQGLGVLEHPRFPDEPWPQPETLPRRLALWHAISQVERKLRQ